MGMYSVWKRVLSWKLKYLISYVSYVSIKQSIACNYRIFLFKLVVDETYIARAIISVLERERLVADGAGVCALAAVMQGLVPELRGKRYTYILHQLA